MSIYLMLAGFGCLAGVTTVLFGFGGGFVVVPLLYRALIAEHGADSATGQSAMHIAVATSTCVMIVSAMLATRRHQRAGTLDWAQVRPLLRPIGAGAVVGAAAAVAADGEFGPAFWRTPRLPSRARCRGRSRPSAASSSG